MPATPFFAGQFTGQTNGTLQVPDYQVELLAIGTQLEKINATLLAQLTTLNQTVAFNTGPAGKEASGTLSASMNAMARNIGNLASNSASTMTKQGEIVAALGSLQTALSRVSATINAGVTTQQIAVTDQIENNKFQQLTTNAALERSGLPPTEVPSQTLNQKVLATINSTKDMKTQVFASNIVETGLQEAVSWTTTTIQNNIADTFIGAQVASAWGALKGWLAKVNSADIGKQLKTETDKVRSETQYI